MKILESERMLLGLVEENFPQRVSKQLFPCSGEGFGGKHSKNSQNFNFLTLCGKTDGEQFFGSLAKPPLYFSKETFCEEQIVEDFCFTFFGI